MKFTKLRLFTAPPLCRTLLHRPFSHQSTPLSAIAGRARPLLRPSHEPSRSTFRCQSTLRPFKDEPPNPDLESNEANDKDHTKKDIPAYELTFTCKPCDSRSTHRMSKQGYHKGSVLITCPKCKARHVMSDHLKIFADKAFTIEDVLRDQGNVLKKGTLSEDGTLEFWDDGSKTHRVEDNANRHPGGTILY